MTAPGDRSVVATGIDTVQVTSVRPRPDMVVTGFLTLALFQLMGEAAHSWLHLPVPGPVIGMFLLAGVLVARKRGRAGPDAPDGGVKLVSDGLIRHMGLLFVPAGVGIVSVASALRGSWVAAAVSLCASTLLSLVVTGVIMHRLSRDPRSPAGRGDVDG